MHMNTVLSDMPLLVVVSDTYFAYMEVMQYLPFSLISTGQFICFTGQHQQVGLEVGNRLGI